MIYYCCDSIRRLSKMNYIDCNRRGQPIIYLQNVNVKTNLPFDLRNYNYCISCGIDTKKHPIRIDSNYVNCCTSLGDGLLNKKIALSFGRRGEFKKNGYYVEDNAHQDHYIFNLNSLDELRVQKYHADYHIQTSLDYCPYCGYGYSVKDEIQNANFLILSNYLV